MSAPEGTEKARAAAEIVRRVNELARAEGNPTTREIAKIAGVSHTSVGEILSGRRLPGWRTLSKTVAALGGDSRSFRALWDASVGATDASVEATSDKPRHLEELIRRYKAAMNAQYGYMQTSLEPSKHAPSLAEVMVPLTIATMDAAHQSIASSQLPDYMLENPHVVLLGDPGSGKTTLCHWLASNTIVNEDVLPFLLHLREVDFRAQPIERSLGEEWSRATGSAYSESTTDLLLATKKVMVILDGLDELETMRRIVAVRAIASFCSRRPEVQVLVTSRPAGYSANQLPPWFKVLVLQELNSTQVAELMSKRTALDNWPKKESLRLLQTLQEGRLRVESPLALSLVLSALRTNGRLPTSEREVMRDSYSFLLDRWDRLRGIDLPSVPVAVLRRFLTELAVASIDKHKIDREQVIEIAQLLVERTFDTNEGHESAFALLEAGLRTGAIREVDALGSITFSHRTFQEYLAAEGIASRTHRLESEEPGEAWTNSLADWIATHMTIPEWSCVASLIPEVAEEKFEGSQVTIINELMSKLPEGDPRRAEVNNWIELAPRKRDLSGSQPISR